MNDRISIKLIQATEIAPCNRCHLDTIGRLTATCNDLETMNVPVCLTCALLAIRTIFGKVALSA